MGHLLADVYCFVVDRCRGPILTRGEPPDGIFVGVNGFSEDVSTFLLYIEDVGGTMCSDIHITDGHFGMTPPEKKDFSEEEQWACSDLPRYILCTSYIFKSSILYTYNVGPQFVS